MTVFPIQLFKHLAAALFIVAMAVTSWSQQNERSATSEPKVIIDVFGLPLQGTKDKNHYALTNYLGRLSEREVSRVLAATQEHAEQRKLKQEATPALYEPTACYLVIWNGTSENCEIWSVGQGWACKVSPGRSDGKNGVVVDESETVSHVFAESRLNAIVEAFIGRFDPALPKAFEKYRSYFETTPAPAGEKK